MSRMAYNPVTIQVDGFRLEVQRSGTVYLSEGGTFKKMKTQIKGNSLYVKLPNDTAVRIYTEDRKIRHEILVRSKEG